MTTDAQRAYELIKERIISLELAPGHVIQDTALIERLGLPYYGDSIFTLADGGEAHLPVYRVLVEWHGSPRPVSVVATEAGALVGMALIEGSRLTLDAIPDGPVRIQPIG